MFGLLRMLAKALGFAAALAWAPASAEMIYHRGNTADPDSLDPSKASTTYEAHVLHDLFEGLVMPDAKANVMPGVAESWQISDDQTVYTFKLRADAVWSNGDPVTADDFVFAFRRLEDPATAAAYASMLYVVKNAEAVNAGKMSPEEIGARALDARTLEITLNAPTPYFLELLTHQSAYPLHKASVERLGADWTRPGNLISNGPFVLTERVPDDHIKIVKNARFHDAADVKLDAVIFYPTQDRSTAIKRFQAGELDSNDELPIEQLADLREKFGDEAAHRGLSRRLLLLHQSARRSRGAILSFAVPYPWPSTASSWPTRSGAAPCFQLMALCLPGSKATSHTDPTMRIFPKLTGRTKLRDPAGTRLRSRQSAEARTSLRHIGEQSEHRHCHPGAAETVRHRGNLAQQRCQNALRPSGWRG